jgi:hypothetical protein
MQKTQDPSSESERWAPGTGPVQLVASARETRALCKNRKGCGPTSGTTGRSETREDAGPFLRQAKPKARCHNGGQAVPTVENEREGQSILFFFAAGFEEEAVFVGFVVLARYAVDGGEVPGRSGKRRAKN